VCCIGLLITEMSNRHVKMYVRIHKSSLLVLLNENKTNGLRFQMKANVIANRKKFLLLKQDVIRHLFCCLRLWLLPMGLHLFLALN